MLSFCVGTTASSGTKVGLTWTTDGVGTSVGSVVAPSSKKMVSAPTITDTLSEGVVSERNVADGVNLFVEDEDEDVYLGLDLDKSDMSFSRGICNPLPSFPSSGR